MCRLARVHALWVALPGNIGILMGLLELLRPLLAILLRKLLKRLSMCLFSCLRIGMGHELTIALGRLLVRDRVGILLITLCKVLVVLLPRRVLVQELAQSIQHNLTTSTDRRSSQNGLPLRLRRCS